MDPQILNVAQLKNILRQYRLSTTGRKVDLIAKMQQTDLSCAWIQETMQ